MLPDARRLSDPLAAIGPLANGPAVRAS